MNSKNTLTWLIVAIALFAFIFVYDRFLRPTVKPPLQILSGLTLSTVTSVRVIPPNAPEIEADQTNGTWRLSKPVAYPAQQAAVESLLAALQKLTPAIRISAGELRQQRNAEMDYGFEPPRLSLRIEDADGGLWELKVGNKTAPGDQVFLRLVGTDGAFVTDADWLKYVPRSADDWCDTALVDFNGNVPDWIILTNGTKVIELRENTTNHLWQITRPLLARADSAGITEAIQGLQAARAVQFISGHSQDLSPFGLQPASLDLWLGNGTNSATALHVGASLTNDASLVYAERQGWGTVLATAKEPLSPWFGPVNRFRDPYLFELSAPVAEITVSGETNFHNFTLEQQGTNGWRVAGETFPADTASVQQFIRFLAGMRVKDFVKDVVTELPAYGLASPARQITLLSSTTNTNAIIAQLLFGVTQTNEVFVRRADEESVYAVSREDFGQLPDAGWEFRNRRIWNFSETNVAQVTLRQDGGTRVIIRNGPNQWSPASGSQGWFYNPAAVEETVHQLGELTATAWLGRNVTESQTPFGFKPGNLSITLELKDGTKDTVDFGLSNANTAVAAVMLDGERWAFVFPPALYQLVSTYLAIRPPHNGVP